MNTPPNRSIWLGSALALSVFAGSTLAATLTVKVSGIAESAGEIGCALYASAEGFPMDNAKAKQVWLRAERDGVVCVFNDLSDGTYAVAVSHDFNGNKKVDTNFVGMPKEPWGSSNNVRPTLRAPRFDEASFKVQGDTRIEIKVAQ